VKTTGINGTIALSVSGSNKSLVWTGAQNSTWDIGGTSPQNWKELPSNVERYFDLDNVTFDDTSNVSTHNVQLNTTVTPTSVTVSANTDYTISGGGTITGTTGLTKSGTGKLTLSNGTNDYSGPTNIQDGTLVIGSSGALSANSALTLGGGVTSGNRSPSCSSTNFPSTASVSAALTCWSTPPVAR
jgi:autotransporter-associated beta strand protein